MKESKQCNWGWLKHMKRKMELCKHIWYIRKIKLGMLKIVRVSKGMMDSPRTVGEDRFGDKLWRVYLQLKTLLKKSALYFAGNKSQRVFQKPLLIVFKLLVPYKNTAISTRKINGSDIMISNTSGYVRIVGINQSSKALECKKCNFIFQ